VTALLLGRELVLEVHAGGAGFDHRAHQLERVQRPAEPGFRVGDDRREPVPVQRAGRPGDLVRAAQRVVDPSDDSGNRAHRIEGLIGIGLAGQVRVGRHLPPGEVDRRESGLHALHRLAAGHAAERRHDVLRPQ
jgi:hypothetical protein